MESSSFLNIAADDIVNDSHFRLRIKFSHLEGRLPSCLYILKMLLHWKHFICMANESYFRHKTKFSLVEGRTSFFNLSWNSAYTENILLAQIHSQEDPVLLRKWKKKVCVSWRWLDLFCKWSSGSLLDLPICGCPEPQGCTPKQWWGNQRLLSKQRLNQVIENLCLKLLTPVWIIPAVRE